MLSRCVFCASERLERSEQSAEAVVVPPELLSPELLSLELLSPEPLESLDPPPQAERSVLPAPTTPAIPIDWRKRRRVTRSLVSELIIRAGIRFEAGDGGWSLGIYGTDGRV
jgi:hypothetical protein